jgi:hypothetical protein
MRMCTVQPSVRRFWFICLCRKVSLSHPESARTVVTHTKVGGLGCVGLVWLHVSNSPIEQCLCAGG